MNDHQTKLFQDLGQLAPGCNLTADADRVRAAALGEVIDPDLEVIAKRIAANFSKLEVQVPPSGRVVIFTRRPAVEPTERGTAAS